MRPLPSAGLCHLLLLSQLALVDCGGKPRNKQQWKQALNSWQEQQNQEFMQDYEDQQKERAEVRQKRLPKFDPENPKAYMDAMTDSSGDGMMAAMGGGSNFSQDVCLLIASPIKGRQLVAISKSFDACVVLNGVGWHPHYVIKIEVAPSFEHEFM